MRGQWIPEHVSLNMTVTEAETFKRLLDVVNDDLEFPLNEMEQQVVDGLLDVLSDGPHTIST